jgi:hypothetical protein
MKQTLIITLSLGAVAGAEASPPSFSSQWKWNFFRGPSHLPLSGNKTLKVERKTRHLKVIVTRTTLRSLART